MAFVAWSSIHWSSFSWSAKPLIVSLVACVRYSLLTRSSWWPTPQVLKSYNQTPILSPQNIAGAAHQYFWRYCRQYLHHSKRRSSWVNVYIPRYGASERTPVACSLDLAYKSSVVGFIISHPRSPGETALASTDVPSPPSPKWAVALLIARMKNIVLNDSTRNKNEFKLLNESWTYRNFLRGGVPETHQWCLE